MASHHSKTENLYRGTIEEANSERRMLDQREAFELLENSTKVRPEINNVPAIIQTVVTASQEYRDGSITYWYLKGLTMRVAKHLYNCSVGKGDIVLLLSPNCPELVSAIMATWMFGAIAVPLDVNTPPQEVERIATNMNAKVILSCPKLKKTLPDIRPAGVHRSIVDNILQRYPSTEYFNSDAHLSESAVMFLVERPSPTEDAKVLDLGTVMKELVDLGSGIDLQWNKSVVLALPLSNAVGLKVCLSSLVYGSTVIFSDISAQGLINSLRSYKADVLAARCTIYDALLSEPNDAIDLSSVQTIYCDESIPYALAEKFQKRFGKTLQQVPLA